MAIMLWPMHFTIHVQWLAHVGNAHGVDFVDVDFERLVWLF
jgi:hypothetical protein